MNSFNKCMNFVHRTLTLEMRIKHTWCTKLKRRRWIWKYLLNFTLWNHFKYGLNNTKFLPLVSKLGFTLPLSFLGYSIFIRGLSDCNSRKICGLFCQITYARENKEKIWLGIISCVCLNPQKQYCSQNKKKKKNLLH